jgi:NAD(P)-dependent dehydrogenase (short-subunit alcohol dehydrogenase family)
MNRFKDKVAIVTGGASGIGRALCELLAGQGAICVVADISSNGAEEVATGIQARGGKASAAHLDVTRAADVQQRVDETIATHGRLDLMFNNAGISIAGEVRDLSLEDWQQVVNVNVMGVIYGAHAAYQVMVRQGFGHIVNTASLAGLAGYPTMTPYSTTKHAVVGLSKSLRAEGEALGVKVTAICPGFIQTAIFDSSPMRKADKEQVFSKLPFKPIDVRIAAQKILQGVAKNKALVVFPFYGRVLWWLMRIYPGFASALDKQTVKDFRAARIE